MEYIHPYLETHQRGSLIQDSELPKNKHTDIDFGIRITNDGRVQISINGESFIRFNPKTEDRSEFRNPPGNGEG